jgi:putative ABC transport system permease protein
MKDQFNPPAWAEQLLDRLAPEAFAEEIKGDLYEVFQEDTKALGLRTARRKYVWSMLGFLGKSFFWKRSSQPSYTSIMFKSYFTMARRSLLAYRGTAAINILGLVVGMAAALTIFAIVRYEESYDTFHSDADQIYRVVRVSGDDMSEFRTGVSRPVPVALKDEISSLKAITTLQYMGGADIDILDSSGTSIRRFREEEGCAMIEPSFFGIFDFHDKPVRWIAGDSTTALKEPFSVVLTQSMAKKYFGHEDPVGRTIQFEKYHNCTITGVLEDFPANSDFPFTILVSQSTLVKLAGKAMEDWGGVNDDHQAYITLHPGQSKTAMEDAIAKVHAAHVSKEMAATRHYLLQPLHDVHFDSRFGNFRHNTISRQTLFTLTLVAIFLLIAASINYINLATAQSVMRSKEIGLRKVMGSNRASLIFQFLLETAAVVFASGIIAIGLSELLLLYLEPVLNIVWDSSFFLETETILTWSIVMILITLLAGLYPSFVVSGFQPVAVLKNRFLNEKIKGFSLRKVLVVVQFTITQIFVVGTFIVLSQMYYFEHADMGFQGDAVINIQLPPDPGGKTTTASLSVLANQLRAHALVSDISYSYTLPSGLRRMRSAQDIGRPDAREMKDYVVYEYGSIDSTYLRLYNIRLLAGRNFNEQDTAGSIIINKTLAKNLQLGTPEEAVGKELKRGGSDKTSRVIGVIDDYYSNSLKEGVDNMMMEANPFNYSTVSVKVNLSGTDASLQLAVQELEKIWRTNFPEHMFNYMFFDENIKAFYEQEQKYAKLFQLFTLVILVIGCLGLYGLITFVVNRKGKEVAIRKVLGAKIGHILVLFSREYIQLILISFFIATPVAYWSLSEWLSGFKNHISLQWWLFLIPGVIVLLIASIVVGSKSLTIARANPVNRLKEE